MVSKNPYNFDILNIYGIDHCCIIKRISKIDALNSLKSADLSEKKDHYRIQLLFILSKDE